jgi:hypothetical protein
MSRYIPIEERDLTKLPKWARQEIERLQRDLEYAHERLEAGPDDSRVFAEPYSDHPRPLGHDAHIAFVPEGGGSIIGDGFKVSIVADGIEVYGGDSLSIYPRSSNVVLIKRERF